MTVVKKFKFSVFLFFIVMVLFIGQSCVSNKQIAQLKYVKEGPKNVTTFLVERPDKTIKPADRLYVDVFALEETTANIFSNPQKGMMDINLMSYEVDVNGDIYFPFVGAIQVNGLTMDMARKKIESELNRYLSNISVRVKFVNNRITVLGEVNKQGEQRFNDDEITVFQALGLAGGINDYGNRETVMLIRKRDNIVAYHTLDLTRKDIIESEFFYVLPDDIIIIEPVKMKRRVYRNFEVYSVLITSLTTLLTLMTFFEIGIKK